MDLISPWNRLLSVIDAWLLNVAAVVGVAIIVFFIVKWFWDKRSGGGGMARGFPLLPIIIGGILAGPTVLVPAILVIVQFIIGVVIRILALVNS